MKHGNVIKYTCTNWIWYKIFCTF